MTRKVRHALHDILEAIERVDQITSGKTLAEFEQNWQLRWLVQRAIEVISEASRAIPSELTDTRPRNPVAAGARNRQRPSTRISGVIGPDYLEGCH